MVRGKKRKGRWMIVSSPERYVVARSLFNNPTQLDAMGVPRDDLQGCPPRSNGRMGRYGWMSTRCIAVYVGS